ncbi:MULTISPECIES: TniB family NTP-binding protein [Mycobacteroides]|nr:MULTISPECIES: TniB family NTP-binding protein [Mycobacteroides]
MAIVMEPEITAVNQLEDRRQPTTTLEGWRRFIEADPPVFELLDDAFWDALADRERTTYNEARVAHHSELVVVTTSSIEAITNQGRLLTLLNQREIGARRGLIISGAAATGKTTAIKQLGRFHELRPRARFPGDDGRIPVVYVTAPPKGSPRKLAMEFARFLGLPTINPRMNVTDISDAVCQVMIDARTDIVVVDEIHNLNLDTRAGEELSDHLKYFTEHLPATFVYAGIEVEKSGLFTGTRGRQLAGRCGVIHTSAFPDAKEWRQLIAAMEGTLRLHRHKPGTLVAEARYLHLRTRGMIGSLAHLIRAAAIQSMLDGSEKVTRELMDTVLIDYAAHTAAARTAC